jgi:hypothetical protein
LCRIPHCFARQRTRTRDYVDGKSLAIVFRHSDFASVSCIRTMATLVFPESPWIAQRSREGVDLHAKSCQMQEHLLLAGHTRNRQTWRVRTLELPTYHLVMARLWGMNEATYPYAGKIRLTEKAQECGLEFAVLKEIWMPC